MSDVVDLSMENDDDPTDEEAQRRSIMSMAAVANMSSGRGGAVGIKAPHSPRHKRPRLAKDHEPSSNRIDMPFATADLMSSPAPAAAAAVQPPPIVSVSQAIPLSPGNALLAALHAERCMRQRAAEQSRQAQPSTAAAPPSTSLRLDFEPGRVEPAPEPPAELSILTYNVWFEESIALQERMAAIGRIIEEAGCPDVLMFQEVTHNIAALWRSSSWWRHYNASPVSHDMPYFTMLCTKKSTLQLSREGYSNRRYSASVMGRGLLSASCTFHGRPLRIATTHLESPLPGNQNEGPRSQQLAEAMGQLGGNVDTIFAGDMNWTSKLALPLSHGWCDAWCELQPGVKGFTYDGTANVMLANRWQARMDRFLVSLQHLQPVSIAMVGCDRLPGVTHQKKGRTLPVLPSDHFGLLLRLRMAPAALARH